MTVEGMSVSVCEACTCVSIPSVSTRVEDHYRARVWGGRPRAEMIEHDDGSIRVCNTQATAARSDAKLQALRAALRLGDTVAPRLLEVGCRDGAFLQAARAQFRGIAATGLEPWLPWRDKTSAQGFRVEALTAEAYVSEGFDIVVEFDLLEHCGDPVAHLEALRSHMAPGGHLVLGVSNFATSAGFLHPHRIRLDAPIGFTRRALRRACAAAGLSAALWEDGTNLFAVCERGTPIVQDADPQEARDLLRSLRENDGRLLLKRVLAKHGPTDAVLRAAETSARGCPTAQGRRALCLDVARACEHGGRSDEAARWFDRGLARDPQSQNVA